MIAQNVSLIDTCGAGHQGNITVPGLTRRVLKTISTLLIAATLNTALLPLAHAVQQRRANAAAQSAALATGSDQLYAQALVQLQKLAHSTDTQNPDQGQAIWAASQADLLQGYAQDMQSQWQTLRAAWGKAGVPASTSVQQQQLETTFQQKHRQLLALLQALQTKTGQPANLQALRDFLDQQLPAPLPYLVKPGNLPWQIKQATHTQPAQDSLQLHKKLQLVQSVQPQQPLQPQLKSATLQTKTLAPASAADTAPTLEAPHTPAIQALAQTLGNNPHKIYQWVHDNIHYTPTYGSVQGAQDTLDKKAGNAFDTNSLLLALLRSSGIAARYVYGSIDIPVAQVQNWVGGAQTAEAAQQIMSQGGIPNTILTQAGKNFAFRLEHIWIEAQLQYQPGRGARHIVGQSVPDTWVPMDGSFKQYTFKQGMDLQTAVPLDAKTLADAAQQGATLNEAQGWVQNLNTSALQNQLAAYQSRLKTHIDSQNAGKSTVGDVLGSRSATIDPLPYFAGSLPYTIQARTSQLSHIPEHLRHQFRYRIYADARSAAWDEAPLLTFQAPTAQLAGKKLTLAWVAATPADEAAIAALIPTVPQGQQLDPSQLPRGISSSIGLKPQILLEGQIKAEGTRMPAGSEPIGAGAFTRYTNWDWDETQDQLIAGQQTALGLSIQGISAAQLQTLQTRMQATKDKLQQAQAAPENQRASILQGMTGDHLTGDLLTATLWGYFAALQSYGTIASSQAHMLDIPALSYGLFHAQVRPTKLFGTVTTGIEFQGLNMDIGHLRHTRWVKNDDPKASINSQPELTQNGKPAAQNRWIAYNKMRGQYNSAMEHAVPEQFWVDKSQCRYADETGTIKSPTKADCAQAISAVKAIAIAQQQGQRIYTITQENAATALPNLPVGGNVGQEIRAAVQAGKEVTIHESPINAHGWSGYGYIITDPETGAGAYIIEGRGNGAVMALFGTALISVVGMYFLPLVAGTALLILAITLSIALHVALLALHELIATGDLDPVNIIQGAAVTLSLMRALSTLLTGLGFVFLVPGGVAMGVVLMAIAIIGFGKLLR